MSAWICPACNRHFSVEGHRYAHEGSKACEQQQALNRMADTVLAYRPKPKTKAAKKRTRKAKRDAKNS